ncbi:MAG: DsbA family protein [Gemmatimonadaceae bacterium]
MARDRTERRRQQRANVVRKQQARNMKPFYIALGVIAIAGVALIAISARRGTGMPNAIDVKATPAQAEGYLMGNPNAPVQIYEFADFECPACATFATITEPDVRKRIVDAGLASYRYFDFPLEQHHNSLAASNAAACAADQGKFWEMHDKLFYNQPEWNSEATDRPQKFFDKYASQIGVNLNTWKTCVAAQSHMQRILSNRAEGMRRHVQSTPTFVIGDKMVAGALSYDQFKILVDSARARLASAHPDSQPGPRAAQ